MSGVDLCVRLKADPRSALTPVIVLTAMADVDARVAGLAAGADDFFAKPCDFLELQTRLAVLCRVKSLVDQPERVTIETHPAVGADLVRGMRSLDDVRPIIRHHHERWDGSGYPDGLAGEGIPLGARIMAVVDVYDALATERPYKAAMPQAEAIATLRRETDAGSWDPVIVRAFADLLPHLEEGSHG